MESESSRLKEFIRVAFDGSVASAATALGWSRTAMYSYLRGERKPGTAVLDQLEKIGCGTMWLRRGDGDMFADNAAGRELRKRGTGESPVQEHVEQELHAVIGRRLPPKVKVETGGVMVHSQPVAIPLFLNPASAGYPTPTGDDIEDWISPEYLITPIPENVFAIRASGSSMLYDGIHDMDILFVDISIKHESGCVIVAVLDGQLCVKRMDKRGKKVYLLPSSQDYDPVEVKPGADLKIWGVVTYVLHSLR